MIEEEIRYQPIGIIHTEFQDKKEAPIQGVFARDAKGEVEVFPEYSQGLKDIEGFSHLILIYHFHLADGYSLVSMPFLEDKQHGIFSIRHFKRPNPIGLSVVKLERVKGNILEISEVDIMDGTPLLDIKPFVPRFDHRKDAKSGWVSNPHIDMVRGESGKHRSG
jgi:tRNA-Thr(GGU) m(6)t(6)A37 methyltransferase TsaA